MKTTTSDLWSELAHAHAKKMDEVITRALLVKTPPPTPLTRWQRFKLFMTEERSFGRWLTYKLMAHYDIYEGDW